MFCRRRTAFGSLWKQDPIGIEGRDEEETGRRHEERASEKDYLEQAT